MTTLSKSLSVLLLAALIAPQATFAASSKPTCTLTASTPSDSVTTSKESTLSMQAGEVVTLTWKGKNATSALDWNGKGIVVSGSATTSPLKGETYTYTFLSGSKKVKCTIKAEVTTATITASTLTAKSGKKPALAGTASGTKTVRVEIVSGNATVYESKSIKVKSNKWKASVSKKLADGTYEVRVYGDGKVKLATGVLNVGKVVSGSLSVSSIPLLSGGSARLGTTVPISYLQVVNTGKTPVTISGFKVSQVGAAPTSIVGFSSIDDKGGSRAETSGSITYNNGVTDVPTAATLAAGERKLFTLKAIIGTNAAAVGSQLRLNVVGINTAVSSLKAVFPIQGTTWTIGY